MHNPLKTHETGNDRLKEALFLHETRNLILLRQNKTLQQSFRYHVTGEGAFARDFLFSKGTVRGVLDMHLESMGKTPQLSHVFK